MRRKTVFMKQMLPCAEHARTFSVWLNCEKAFEEYKPCAWNHQTQHATATSPKTSATRSSPLNTVDFVKKVRAYLNDMGWKSMGFDGQWQLLQRHAGPTQLPTAITHEFREDCMLGPLIEQYLTANGWVRVRHIVTCGLPVFSRRDEEDPDRFHYKNLLAAMAQQLNEGELCGKSDEALALCRRRLATQS